jgi:2-oxoglutarate dehydrogenase E2 component (dihydrolipoamide succinyltransferase)
MVESKKISAHVQSFVEADVTNLWEWRERIKESFFNQTQEKLTFTPLFILAVVKALRDFPILNSSLQNESILQKRDINIGMATSLSDGNLIVPVIKNADHLNLIGLTKAVNDLSSRARKNQLLPEDVQDGTYTVTNVGNFGSIMGTPIINQPQVGILAIGVIRKMPSVIETSKGDYIGIRRKLILSHSYDHRIINGAIGGQFAKNIANYLEDWDLKFSF